MKQTLVKWKANVLKTFFFLHTVTLYMLGIFTILWWYKKLNCFQINGNSYENESNLKTNKVEINQLFFTHCVYTSYNCNNANKFKLHIYFKYFHLHYCHWFRQHASSHWAANTSSFCKHLSRTFVFCTGELEMAFLS